MVTDCAAIGSAYSYAGKPLHASIGKASKDRNGGSTGSRVAIAPATWPCLLA
jgi:hypothetical protein